MESDFILAIPGPPPMLAACDAAAPHTMHKESLSVPRNPMEDLIGDGFLWGVPKNRRSRERRLIRKFGLENWHKKMLPIRKLLTCDECGHVYEPGRLCRRFLALLCGVGAPVGSHVQSIYIVLDMYLVVMPTRWKTSLKNWLEAYFF